MQKINSAKEDDVPAATTTKYKGLKWVLFHSTSEKHLKESERLDKGYPMPSVCYNHWLLKCFIIWYFTLHPTNSIYVFELMFKELHNALKKVDHILLGHI